MTAVFRAPRVARVPKRSHTQEAAALPFQQEWRYPPCMLPLRAEVPTERIHRLSVAQYHGMLDAGTRVCGWTGSRSR